MKKISVWCLLILVFAVAGASAETTSYYFSSVFMTNPQNNWSLQYGPRGDLSARQLMTPDGSASWYDGWNSGGTRRPSFGEFGGGRQFRTQEMYAVNDAYAVFTCPETGAYSLDLSLKFIMQTVYSSGLQTDMEVYVTGNSTPIWSSNRVWTAAGNYTCDLRFYPELQQMSLNAGDEIIIRFAMENYYNYSEAVFYILSSGLTPEVSPCVIFGEEGEQPVRYILEDKLYTNPQDEWSLYYGADVETMTPMTNISGYHWRSGAIRPSYGEYNPGQFRVRDLEGDNNAYYVFTCPDDGLYSLQYKVLATLQQLFDPELNTYYAVYTKSGTAAATEVWSYTLNWTYKLTYPLNFGVVDEFQDMPLLAGDQIILELGIENIGNYNECVHSFGGVTEGTLPFIGYKEGAALLPGDANGDGFVDVGDLGILAANYGTTTGATWATGDFNGDGAVDVGDLGILAANYGSGTSEAANFDADYAKVFGESASDEEVAVDSLCSSIGLPLIAGLLIVGLMLVKLED